jgi:hypothetical protein
MCKIGNISYPSGAEALPLLIRWTLQTTETTPANQSDHTISRVNVCMLLYYIRNRRTTRKGKQTNTRARNSKINEEKQQKNTNGNMRSVTTCRKRQKASEADSFRNMKVKISYTHEDGHVDRNM